MVDTSTLRQRMWQDEQFMAANRAYYAAGREQRKRQIVVNMTRGAFKAGRVSQAALQKAEQNLVAATEKCRVAWELYRQEEKRARQAASEGGK